MGLSIKTLLIGSIIGFATCFIWFNLSAVPSLHAHSQQLNMQLRDRFKRVMGDSKPNDQTDSTPQAGAVVPTGHTEQQKPVPPAVVDPSKAAPVVADPDGASQADDWLTRCKKIANEHAPALKQAHARPMRNITLVSALLDLGRGDLGAMFHRDFSEYIDRFKRFMSYDYPKIIMIDEAHYDEIKPLIKDSPAPTHVLFKSKDDLRKFRHFDAIQKVRTTPTWFNRQGWLAEAPQAKMEFYNPLVMSKVFWATEAAELNPFNTDGFLFIDGGHLCNNPGGITRKKEQWIIDNLLSSGIMITFFDYVPAEWNGEIHGFVDQDFYRYIGSDQLPVAVGRGGIFGGRLEDLRVAAGIIDVIAEETLGKGFMGTEENLFSILQYRFPDIVHRFDNADGGNCAVFSEIVQPRLKPEDFPYALRGVVCVGDWRDKFAAKEPSCFHTDHRKCGYEITPPKLQDPGSQAICKLTDQYFCTVQCDGNNLRWTAEPCGGKGQRHCPDPPAYTFDEPEPEPKPGVMTTTLGGKSAKPVDVTAEVDADSPLAPSASLKEWKHVPKGEEPPKYTPGPYKKFSAETHYNFRGLQCGTLNGVPRCYSMDDHHVELCPPSITPESLTNAATQYFCKPEVESHYCNVACQDGNPDVRWGANEVLWCNANPGSCPKQPEPILKSEFKLKPIPKIVHHQLKCHAKAKAEGIKAGVDVPNLTAGLLTHATVDPVHRRTLMDTLTSYEERGFFDRIPEFLIYVNGRNQYVEEMLKPFLDRNKNIKLMGDTVNHGILNALNWMAGNATSKYVLFLEKDFQMTEPWACAGEQLNAGIKIIEKGTAEVLRFRSRWAAGYPNWAERMFRGNEEDVFQGQLNLFCNHFHWVPHPDTQWPEHIWGCKYGHDSPGKDPTDGKGVSEDPAQSDEVGEGFYCSKAKYCNWTNNPTLIDTKWWHDNYVVKFPKFKIYNPYDNVEMYMNWEENAWNEMPYTVAQGYGMFKHVDRNNFAFF